MLAHDYDSDDSGDGTRACELSPMFGVRKPSAKSAHVGEPVTRWNRCRGAVLSVLARPLVQDAVLLRFVPSSFAPE